MRIRFLTLSWVCFVTLTCVSAKADFYMGAAYSFGKMRAKRKESIGFTGGYKPSQIPPGSFAKKLKLPGLIFGYGKRCPLWISAVEVGFDNRKLSMATDCLVTVNDEKVTYKGAVTKKNAYYVRGRYGSVIGTGSFTLYGFCGLRFASFQYQYNAESVARLGGGVKTYPFNETFTVHGVEVGAGIEKGFDDFVISGEFAMTQFRSRTITNIDGNFMSELTFRPRFLTAGIRIAYAFG